MATPHTHPLVAPADDPAPAQRHSPRAAGAMETVTGIMTARWRAYVLTARAAGVPRATLERTLLIMANQVVALYGPE
jgi:hypothetical protein